MLWLGRAARLLRIAWGASKQVRVVGAALAVSCLGLWRCFWYETGLDVHQLALHLAVLKGAFLVLQVSLVEVLPQEAIVIVGGQRRQVRVGPVEGLDMVGV
jgi:hypothetical protein